MVTKEQLLKIMPQAKSRIDKFYDPLVATMKEFGIDTKLRQAAFLAQIAVESGQLLYVKELASGSAYEGRVDLGNTQKGDGVRYKGRGLIQITGKANYADMMMALDIDCLNRPEVVEETINACRSAGWYWKTRNLAKWADKGDIDGVSDVVNRGRKTDKMGDSNGWNERLSFYNKAMEVL